MKSRIFYLGTFLVLALLAPVGACMPNDTPVIIHYSGTGGGAAGFGPVSCGGSSGTTSDLATWANVRDIIDGHIGIGCFGSDCHTEGDREPYLLALGANPLSDMDLYAKLRTYKATKCGGRQFVNPCNPDQSAFYLAQAHTCGDDLPQMPFGCDPDYPNCTPPENLEGIRQWIAKGAPAP